MSPSLRLRSIFSATAAAALSAWAQSPVVINEIHYNPDIKTEHVEFIELSNVGADTVDLTGWQLTAGVSYTFLSGTILPANGYIVVAQDPAALKQKFGATALGPWHGMLSNTGEKVVLRDAAGQVQNEVDYRLGFPWPTVGDPPGYSIELVNPGLDSNLGGNWRSWTAVSTITNEVVVYQGSTNVFPVLLDTNLWRYDQSGNDLGTAWQGTTFNDSAWPSGLPLFYVETAGLPWTKSTPLSFTNPRQMTYYFRTHFNCPADLTATTNIIASVLLDDGAVFYLNGTEVYRLGMPSGPVNSSTSAVRNVGDATAEEYFPISSGNLVPGDNVMAVEVHQSNLNSSDIVFGMRLYGLSITVTNVTTNYVVTTNAIAHGPTPGKRNSAFAQAAPPQMRQVDHQPGQPRSGEPVRITTKATSPSGVASVGLAYQAVDPGNYIELTDALYQTSWVTVPMHDDGTDGDQTPGDRIFTVTLPASLQAHRRLVRYRLVATDTAGLMAMAPGNDDPQPNFAYFVYDGVPAWTGAAQPGVTPLVAFDTNVMRRLPTYHLIAKRSAVEDSTWFSRAQDSVYRWSGTLVYDGQVYDHIHYRARGGVWRYSMVKNMWKFDFNRGHEFQARDNYGRSYQTAWTKLNLGACIQQGDYQHRGEQGMFEAVGFKLFNLAGVEACKTHWIQFRVIDDAVEANPQDQYEGDFWGLYLVIEQPDGRFLDEHSMPDGNFYKMDGGFGTLNNQGAYAVSDSSDLSQFMSAYRASSPSPSDDWWRANLDLPRYYGYRTIVEAIHHYDLDEGAGKNYFYFLNPENRRWSVHPWDLDLTWANNMYGGGNSPFKNRVLPRPAFNLEYRNRIREIRDLLFNAEQTGRLIDEYAAMIHDPNGAPSITDADRAMWDYNPKMVNSQYSTSPNKAGQGRFYQFPQEPSVPKNFDGTIRLMKNYIGTRGAILDSMSADTAIPATPTLASSTATNFPANQLQFVCSPFVGPGAGFAAMAWRLAEVSPAGLPLFDGNEPKKYEINATWESGELTAYDAGVTVSPAAVKVGHLYRVRARMKDTTGRWSHWSAPLEFAVGEPDNVAALTESLRVTEVMYDPAGGGDYEYIELHNTSSSIALDLAGVKFTQGIDFTFGANTVLLPGGYVLVVKAPSANNFAGFRAQYGLVPEIAVVGPYSGSLDNKGETVTVKTAPGGSDLLSFGYGNGRGWPVAADGAGHSLVPLEAAVAQEKNGSLDYGPNWRSSTWMGGSPGRADPPADPGVVLNEVMAHTVLDDPQMPEYNSNDWIELYNQTTASINLRGWYLSDDAASLKKWAVPDVTLPAKGWVSFDEISGFHHPIANGFGLNSAGEQLFLTWWPESGNRRVADSVRFMGQELGYSLGRFPDGGGYWSAMVPSRDAANQPPTAGIIIKELAYYPEMTAPKPGSTNGSEFIELEYIELFNSSPNRVDLFDTNGTWRLEGGISYVFPANMSIAPGQRLLLVNFSSNDSGTLAAFRTAYGITNSATQILGPFAGKLGNQNDRVTLEKPQAGDAPGAPVNWIVVDEVIYDHQAPWPIGPGGFNISLQRRSPAQSGNDPANWIETLPSPGWDWPASVCRFQSIRQPVAGMWELMVQGRTGYTYILQGSIDLAVWSSMATNHTLDGAVYFNDWTDTNHPVRFYRVLETDPPSAPAATGP